MDKARGQLIKLDEARRSLAKIASVDEAKKIRDQAEALRNYAKQQKMGLESQNSAAEIKIRAERRAGELLAGMERKPGPGRGKKNTQVAGSFGATIKAAGIEPDAAARWQKQAEIPEEVFDEFVEVAKSTDQELTSAATVRFAKALEKGEPARKAAKDSLAYRWEVETGKIERMVSFFEEHAGESTAKQRKSLEVVLSDAIKRLRALKRSIA